MKNNFVVFIWFYKVFAIYIKLNKTKLKKLKMPNFIGNGLPGGPGISAARQGDLYVDTTNGADVYILIGSSPSIVSNWKRLSNYIVQQNSQTGSGVLIVKDEGVALSNNAASLNFVGATVTATESGNEATITVTSNATSSNIVYVDATYGNDITGIVDRLDKPFQTLSAAYTAASAGDTIYVFPGTYDLTSVHPHHFTSKNMNFYFSNGSVMTNFRVANSSAPSSVNINISGYGEFNYAGVTYVTRWGTSSGSGTLTLKWFGKKMFLDSTMSEGISTDGTGLHEISINMSESIIHDTNGNKFFGAAGNKMKSITLTAPIITCGVLYFFNAAPVADNEFTVNATTLTVNDALGTIGTATSFTGKVNINANVIKSSVPTSNSLIQAIASGYELTIKGDIYYPTSGAIMIGAAHLNDGTLRIYGKITCTSNSVLNIDSNSDGKYVFYDDIIVGTAVGSSISAILVAGTSNTQLEISRGLYNRFTSSTAHGILFSTNSTTKVKLLPMARIVLGNTSANAVNDGGVGVSIQSYPGCTTNATTAVSGTVTQTISTILSNSSVS